jgi:NADH-quinone oxidoreductase subunit C
MMSEKNLKKEILIKKFNNAKIYSNEKYIEIQIDYLEIFNTVKRLKEDSNLQFDQLIDLTAIDYPSQDRRFHMVYLLMSMTLNQRILIKSSLGDGENIASITPIHKAANWYERECYDLFGIQFSNHPDLRRIMTDYNFEGHPLRKDFPLSGFTEVRYDDLEKKVVYEPVKLTQEYRNFDFMSPWEGLNNQLVGDEKSKDSD